MKTLFLKNVRYLQKNCLRHGFWSFLKDISSDKNIDYFIQSLLHPAKTNRTLIWTLQYIFYSYTHLHEYAHTYAWYAHATHKHTHAHTHIYKHTQNVTKIHAITIYKRYNSKKLFSFSLTFYPYTTSNPILIYLNIMEYIYHSSGWRLRELWSVLQNRKNIFELWNLHYVLVE